jgi:hypothetical protein
MRAAKLCSILRVLSEYWRMGINVCTGHMKANVPDISNMSVLLVYVFL